MRAVSVAWLVALLSTSLAAQVDPTVSFLSHENARPLFEALDERQPTQAAWSEWIAASDHATRARVAQGDEMSIVNLLLFGTSFTKEPRITSRQLAAKDISRAVSARLRDLERALAQPGADERLQFAHRIVGDGKQVKARLLTMLERAIDEGELHKRLVQQAEALGDPSLEFAERSRLYRSRGLSSDTSIRINFAVEEALTQLPDPPIVRRIAVVGPGLDFTDKQEGYDFYPPQTIQPFAVFDSLVRLGFAKSDDLEVTTFDVNPRVNDHIIRSRSAAHRGTSYVLHLPLDALIEWSPELRKYWSNFGDRIGDSANPVPVPPAAGDVKVRAIRVRPAVVQRVTPRDLNIIVGHLELPRAEQFDIIIATNVFVYYDRLQQSLAMKNLAKMIRPSGILLSNNAVVELPSTGWRSIGYSKTLYSDREEDGDVIVWYQMAARQ